MSDSFLDNIHQMIDNVEVAISLLRSSNAKNIGMHQIEGLCYVISELTDWSSVYNSDLPGKLRVPATTLRRMARMEGKLERHAALTIADRTRSYLKSLDSATPQDEQPQLAKKATHDNEAKTKFAKTISFDAEKWILVKKTDTTQAKITATVLLLESIIIQINGTNLPEREQVLNQIEKQQLIAILETALSILNSPVVEVGLFKKLSGWLREAAVKTVEKQVQEGLGTVMSDAATSLAGLVKEFFTN